MKFDNLNDLMRYIKKTTRYPLQQVAIRIEEILKNYIMVNWYAKTPEDYARTYDFVNSLTIEPVRETDNGWETRIYFDNEKIRPQYADDDRFWNKHMSVYGEDVSDSIPEYIEYGNKSPLYNYEGIHMVQNTIDYCQQYDIPVKEMMKELKKYGFTFK